MYILHLALKNSNAEPENWPTLLVCSASQTATSYIYNTWLQLHDNNVQNLLCQSYSRRCLLRWTTSGCNSDARRSTLTVVDSSPIAWHVADKSASWRVQRSLSREWPSVCRHTRCHVSSRQPRIVCFSASTAAVRSSMNRWYCCSTREHELTYISYTAQHDISVISTTVTGAIHSNAYPNHSQQGLSALSQMIRFK